MPSQFGLRFASPTIGLAVTLGISLLVSAPARAQWDFDAVNHAYFATGDTTLDSYIGSNEVFVGKDNAQSFSTLPGVITLTTGPNAFAFTYGGTYGGTFYSGINVFGNHRIDARGGFLSAVTAYDSAKIDVTQGTLFRLNLNDTSQATFSGGSAFNVTTAGNSTLTLTGGGITSLNAYDTSRIELDGIQFSFNGPFAYNSAILSLTSGTVDVMNLYDSSTGLLSGGANTAIQANNSARIDLSGTAARFITLRDAATLDVTGGSLEKVTLEGISTALFHGGSFTTTGGSVSGYYNSLDRSNYRVREYNLTGTLADGSAIDTTFTAAADSLSVDATTATARGILTDKAADLYLIADTTVTDLFNNVTIGKNAEGTVTDASPTVGIGTGADLASVTVYNGSTVDITGGIVRNGVIVRDTATLTIQGGELQGSYNAGLTVRDNGTATLSDGVVANLDVSGTGHFTQTGGNLGSVFLTEQGNVTHSGGQIGTITLRDNSQATVDGTANTGAVTVNQNGQLTLNGGAIVLNIQLNDSGAAIVNGGTVFGVNAVANSHYTQTGGTIYDLGVAENAVAEVSGGSVNNRLFALGDSVSNISGGTIGTITTVANAAVTISGGTIGKIDTNDSSHLDISGGTFTGDLTATFNSAITISGGSFGGNLFANDFSSFDFFGSDLNVTASDVRSLYAGANLLIRDYSFSGHLSDGTTFDKTMTGAAGDFDGPGDITVRGILSTVAPDLYITAPMQVNHIYNRVYVGQSQDGQINNSPEASFETKTDVGAVTVLNGSHLRINDGIVRGGISTRNFSTVDINEGVIRNQDTNFNPRYVLDASGRSTVNLNGGLLEGDGSTAVQVSENATFNINGGSISQMAVGVFGSGHLTMTAGTLEGRLFLSDNATTKIEGGTINGGFFGGISLRDNSRTEILGGTIDSSINMGGDSLLIVRDGLFNQGISAGGSSDLRIYGGTFLPSPFGEASVDFRGDRFTVFGGDLNRIQMSGGTLAFRGGTCTDLYAAGFSETGIYDGHINNLTVGYFGLASVYGGSIDEIYSDPFSNVILYGGIISPNTIYQNDDSALVQFVGASLGFTNPTEGYNTLGQYGIFYDVHWVRKDGTALDTRYFDVNGNLFDSGPQGVLFVTTAPEPGSLGLLLPGALGFLALARRRRSLTA